METSGDEAVALAAKAGLYLDEWQKFVLINGLGERLGGGWAAKTVGICVGRQNGKNAILEARELFGLFLLDEKLIIHSAHEQFTASEHFRRILQLIEGVPEFDKRVLKVSRGKGSEAIELKGGQRIFFKTRSGSTVRGASVDCIVYDEAMQLSPWAKAAMIPSMAAKSMKGNLQIWYTGSSVDQQNPKHDGVEFSRTRQRGLDKADGVAWFEWSIPGDNPDAVDPSVLDDPAQLARANPGMGIRISWDWIRHERTVEMGQREFAVERGGIGDWPDPDGSAGAFDLAKWRALQDGKSEPHSRIVCSFDINPEREFASIAVAGKRSDGDYHIEVVERQAGTEWLAARLTQVVKDHGLREVFCDGVGAAASMVPELKERGVRVTKMQAAEHVQACGLIYDMVERLAVRHRGTPELDAAVRGAERRQLDAAWAWNRRKSDVDISPLVACTLALWGCAKYRSGRAVGWS